MIFDANDMTEEDLDFILRRFDASGPKLQRRIVAQLTLDNHCLRMEKASLKSAKESSNGGENVG